MKILRLAAIAATITATTISAYAKPALKEIRTVKQPDGTSLNIRVTGDEHFHVVTTEDGYILHKDDDGFYRMGQFDPKGAVVSTGIHISDTKSRLVATNIKDVDLATIKKIRKSNRRMAPQSGLGLSKTSYPVSGSPKGLVILVEFKDVKFNSSYNATEYFNDMINGTDFTQYGGTGSALSYFTEQSKGKFTPDFDVLGPVTLQNNCKYYGANNKWGEDENAHLIVSEAITALDPTVDFSVYDTDKDGFIDNVYVFYAGQGEADYGDEDTIWPHSWDLRDAGITKRVDGVVVAQYACSNEWGENKPDGVGTFVHEFSHVMGLPDLYHTSNSTAVYTPDAYSVMDYGPYNNDGRTPPNYSAYEKNAMGWFEPIMLDEAKTVSLEDISSGQFGLIPTSRTTEFFLLENRQQKGWDKYIPNHGMLIWHIDFVASVFDNNEVNNNKNHQYVDIVEANDKQDYKYSEGYTFPGTSGNTSFTSSTKPALVEWSGKAIDFPITDIVEKDGIISFKVAGGGSSLLAPEPWVEASSEKEMFFIAEWKPVEGATDYLLSVYAGEGGADGTISTGFDNSELSEGWTASETGWYTTASNYGEASPSFKLSKADQVLTSPVVEGDITGIEFWVKGQSTNNTHLKIEGLVNGSWVLISYYTPQTNKVETVTLDSDIPVGVRQVRFSIVKSTGNIALDDIKITYGGGAVLLPDYDNVSTNGKTSYKVDRLKEGVYNYYFLVTATDGEFNKTSSPCYVTIKGENIPSGISDVELEDEEPVYYNLQGVRISNPRPGSIVIEKRGKSTRKVLK